MNRRQTWGLGIGVVLAVLGSAWFAIIWWLPSDEELALRFTAEAEQRLGVKVSLGAVHWSLLPMPAITVNDFRTQQAQPLIVGKLSVYPKLSKLLQGTLVLDRVEVDDATIPRNSVSALHVKHDTAPHVADEGVLLEHFAVRNFTWISYGGIATSYDGEVDFDPHWRPRHAALRRPGVTPPFVLTLARDGDEDRWQTHITVGGGTANGHLALKTAEDGVMQLSGQLAPLGIEVASAIGAFNRRSPISGSGSGQTVVSASGKSPGELARSLHTQTRFTVSSAVLLRFDLDKAINTLGKEHDGQTPLQEMTGQLDTQNGAEGMRLTGTEIFARAGKFTATGKGTVYHGQIEASANVDIIEGAIGVPITLSGSVHKPKVSVPPGFLAGAAIGTVVLPVIGTAIGARIGGAIGKLFKGDPQSPVPDKKGAPQK